MKKIIAMDLDGTLLTSDKRVSDVTKKAIREASEKGVEFAFATGRMGKEMDYFRKEVPWVRYGICCNGACVNDFKENKVLYRNFISMDEVRQVYEQLGEFKILMEIYAEEDTYAERDRLEHIADYGIEEYAQMIVDTRVAVDDMERFIQERQEPIGKLNMFFLTVEERQKAQKILTGQEYEVTSQIITNLEVNHLGSSKGDGINFLAKHLGMTADDVIAIGDNMNDLSMREATNHLIAMDNACDELKNMADDITDNNDKDGVAKTIVKYTS